MMGEQERNERMRIGVMAETWQMNFGDGGWSAVQATRCQYVDSIIQCLLTTWNEICQLDWLFD